LNSKIKEESMKRNPMKITAVLDVSAPAAMDSAARKVLPNKPAKLRGAFGRQIVCVEGRLWVTQAGDYEDHILEAGDSLALRRRGPVIIGAFGAARYAIA
jgi:hypothetical protein